MPNKQLPNQSLKNLLFQQLRKKSPEQNQNPQPNLKKQQPRNNSLDNPFDINLVDDTLFLYDRDRYSSFVQTSRKIIWGTAIIFTILLGVNFVLDLRLNSLKNVQDDFVSKVERRSGVETKFNTLKDSVDFYQTAVLERKELSNKVSLAFEYENSVVDMDQLTLTPTSFIFKGTAPRALDFTFLINSYLKSGLVSQIVLRESTFNSRNNTYSVNMEVFFND